MEPKLSYYQELERLLEKVEHEIETAQYNVQCSATDLETAQNRLDRAKQKHSDALLNESMLLKAREIIKYHMATTRFDKEDN